MISSLTHLDHKTGHGAVAWMNTNDCPWPEEEGKPGFGIDTAALPLDNPAEAVVPSSKRAAEEQQPKCPYDLKNMDHWSLHNLIAVDWHRCQYREGPGLSGTQAASLRRQDWRRIWGPERVLVESVDSRH